MSVNDAAWLDKLQRLNRWAAHGERAPHKPLLLLYMIGRLQRLGTASVEFAEAEPDLRRILEEFGPPRKTSPAYPFHHLVSDGIWVVKGPHGEDSPGAKLIPLRAGYRGELARDFARALEMSPRLVSDAVGTLLNMQFPSTLHEDILQAVGIDISELALAGDQQQPLRKRRRDPAFRDRVLTAYEFRCAACGYEGLLGQEAIGVEAAHIKWWAASGPDDLSNGIALCSIHHKLLDRGAIGITDTLTFTVSQHFRGGGSAAQHLVLSLVDQPMNPPLAGNDPPHRSHILWHQSQVFRSPARLAQLPGVP